MQVVNTRREVLSDCLVEATVFDLNGETKSLSKTFERRMIPAKITSAIGNIPMLESESTSDQSISFLLLKLSDSSGALISRNFYWLHRPGGNYSELGQQFRTLKVPVTTSATGKITTENNTHHITVHVTNKTIDSSKPQDHHVAFGLYFSVVDTNSKALDPRILPVNYSQNWFSLVPNEALDIFISFKLHDKNARPKLILRGWNIVETEVALEIQQG
jgi:mannosylglycoprotein endo-beta-mannosidase